MTVYLPYYSIDYFEVDKIQDALFCCFDKEVSSLFKKLYHLVKEKSHTKISSHEEFILKYLLRGTIPTSTRNLKKRLEFFFKKRICSLDKLVTHMLENGGEMVFYQREYRHLFWELLDRSCFGSLKQQIKLLPQLTTDCETIVIFVKKVHKICESETSLENTLLWYSLEKSIAQWLVNTLDFKEFSGNGTWGQFFAELKSKINFDVILNKEFLPLKLLKTQKRTELAFYLYSSFPQAQKMVYYKDFYNRYKEIKSPQSGYIFDGSTSRVRLQENIVTLFKFIQEKFELRVLKEITTTQQKRYKYSQL